MITMEVVQKPEDQQESASPSKKSRKRLKHTCSKIREQMEFYFSDANLQKDRYLKKLMDQSEDGYIELSLFTNFNKLRALTDDMALVAKALSTSTLLQVSDDKKKIKRAIPLSDPKDTDERTVYVECLPRTASHDWVKSTFAPCGRVVYVSLPRYRTTKDIKGFGFVEFATQEGARKACEMLNNPPVEAGERLGKFPRANKQIKQLESKLRSHKDLAAGDGREPRSRRRQRTLSESAASETKPKHRKRNRTTSMGSDSTTVNRPDDLEPIVKRLKSEEQGDSSSSSSSSSVESDEEDSESKDEAKRLSRKRKPECEGEQEIAAISPKKVRISEDVKIQQVSEGTKKKRKRHRKNKTTKDEGIKKELPELRVIPKSEWLELRKEYIQYQKSSMRKLKQSLRDIDNQNENIEIDSAKDGKTPSPGQKARPPIEYVPNVIIKVMSTNELGRKEVKAEASKIAEVAYVDIPDGGNEGFIRCHKAEEAAKLVAAETEGHSYTLLQGPEEEQYWDKLRADRENKLSSKSRPKRRGRDKIFKKLEKANEAKASHKAKHVVFDDE